MTFPIHGSVRPKADEPLVAQVDIDRPPTMKGSVGFATRGGDRVKTVARFDVELSEGQFVAVSSDTGTVDVGPPEGAFDVAFGTHGTESIDAFNLDARAEGFMLQELFFDMSVSASSLPDPSRGGATFVSPNGAAWLKQITEEFAMKIGRLKLVIVPVNINNARQFRRSTDHPLPRPGQPNVVLAQCATRTSVVRGIINPLHDPRNSFVSQELMTSGAQAERDRIQNHEQRHMDIMSFVCAMGNVFVEVAQAGKTGQAKTSARQAALVELLGPSGQLGTIASRLNEDYDDETRNGTITAAQKDWDDNLDKKTIDAWKVAGPEFAVPR